MPTQYGLQIQSAFDPKSSPTVIVVVKKGENKTIDRATVPGVLVVRVFEGSVLKYSENIKEAGLYHTYIILEGEKASCTIVSNIAAEGDQLLDIVHTVTHQKSNTISDIKVRGMAKNNAHIIYQNDILAEKSVKNIIGNEKADFLLLDDCARISAIPKLSVYTSDIVCSHALSISNVNKASLEYLMQRGYTKDQAQVEIVNSFFL